MRLIVLLLGFGLNRYWVGTHPLYQEQWMDRYRDWMESREFADDLGPDSRMLLLLGAPVVTALIFFWLIKGWLLGLIWVICATVVLGYSTGLSSLSQRLQSHLQWLKTVKIGDDLEKVKGNHREMKKAMVSEEFESLYPQVFWFLVAGPAGALLYRLAGYYAGMEPEDEDEETFVSDLLQILEWLPARMTACAFAVVGNFNRTTSAWAETHTDWRTPTREFLEEVATGAVAEGENAEDDITKFILNGEREVFLLRDLLNRTLAGWLALIALLVLLGWN